MQYFCVTVPPAVRGLTLLGQMGMGSLTCAQIWVRAVHTKWQSGTTKQVCTRIDSEGQKICTSPCPARGSNPGSSDFNSDVQTTEIRPPFQLIPCRISVYISSMVITTQSVQDLSLSVSKKESTRQSLPRLARHAVE